jgi:hypothetical protein
MLAVVQVIDGVMVGMEWINATNDRVSVWSERMGPTML